MKFNFNITQNDIANGEKGNCSKCPVARAVNRNRKFKKHINFKKDEILTVGFRRIFKRNPSSVKIIYTWNLPIKAIYFIYDFDHRNPVKPFKFTLEVN